MPHWIVHKRPRLWFQLVGIIPGLEVLIWEVISALGMDSGRMTGQPVS
jgi:hypothetical protein